MFGSHKVGLKLPRPPKSNIVNPVSTPLAPSERLTPSLGKFASSESGEVAGNVVYLGALTSDPPLPNDGICRIWQRNDLHVVYANLNGTTYQIVPPSGVGAMVEHANEWHNPDMALASDVPKSNLSASVDPAVTDDSGDGYSVGSRWVNIASGKEFVCLDAAVGVAVWTETTGGGGGHVIEDEGVPLTARASLNVKGAMARAVDNTPDTDLEVRGRTYDAIVDTVEGYAGANPSPPIYTTLQQAITDNQPSIFVRSNIDAESDVTIGSAAQTRHILGRGVALSKLPNINTDRSVMVIEYCTLENKKITVSHNGSGTVFMGLYITGTAITGHLTINAQDCSIIRCAFLAASAPVSFSFDVGFFGGYGDVTACTFTLCSGVQGILTGGDIGAVIGCRFKGNTFGSGTGFAIYLNAFNWQVSGCVFGDVGCYSLRMYILGNAAGNTFTGDGTKRQLELGGAYNVISGNIFKDGLPCIYGVAGPGQLIANNLFYWATSANSEAIHFVGTAASMTSAINGNTFLMAVGGVSVAIELSDASVAPGQLIMGNMFASVSTGLLYAVFPLYDRTVAVGNGYNGKIIAADRGLQYGRAFNNSSGTLPFASVVIMNQIQVDKCWVYDAGTGFIDRTAEANSYGGTPFDLIPSTSGELYLGIVNHRFASILFELATLASTAMTLVVSFSKTGPAWQAVDKLKDGTAGFTKSSEMRWAPLTTHASVAVNGFTAYWIRITSVSTPATRPTANRTLSNDLDGVITSVVAGDRPKIRGVAFNFGAPSTLAFGSPLLVAFGGVFPLLCDTAAVVQSDFIGMSTTTAGRGTPLPGAAMGEIIGQALGYKEAGVEREVLCQLFRR